jgi:hypothetical protein
MIICLRELVMIEAELRAMQLQLDWGVRPL